MSTTDLVVNHLANNAQTSNSGSYEADLARMKADLGKLLRTKLGQLGINPSKNRLYQRPYPMPLIWFLTLQVSVFLTLLNLVVTVIGQLGNTLANMLLSFVRLFLITLCVFACFRCL